MTQKPKSFVRNFVEYCSILKSFPFAESLNKSSKWVAVINPIAPSLNQSLCNMLPASHSAAMIGLWHEMSQADVIDDYFMIATRLTSHTVVIQH